MPDHGSTLEGLPDRPRTLGARLASRFTLLVLLVACVAGATGLLGGHTSTVVSDRNGFHMQLSYPGTARPGLDTLWELQVTHPGGFSGPITIAVSGSYFDLFETQGFYPTPMATTRDGSFVYLKFTPPPEGETFVVMYDAYIQPYIEPTHLLANDATVALVNHQRRIDTLHFSTWLFP